MRLFKITAYYLVWNILLSPIMILIFGFSAMLYDSGVPSNFLDHLSIVAFVLYIFLIPSLAVISKGRESILRTKNIEVSYKEIYIIGGILAFIPAFIFTFINMSPKTIFEVALTIVTPIIEILLFIIINYIYNTNKNINIIFKMIGKLLGFGLLALIIIQTFLSQF